jgi:uncharacterized membrane protein
VHSKNTFWGQSLSNCLEADPPPTAKIRLCILSSDRRNLVNIQPTETSHSQVGVIQTVFRLLLGAVLLFTGFAHLTWARTEFLAQVPNWLPLDADLVVVLSGLVELALGAALILLGRYRVAVGWIVAAFFVAIFPHRCVWHVYRRCTCDPTAVSASSGCLGAVVNGGMAGMACQPPESRSAFMRFPTDRHLRRHPVRVNALVKTRASCARRGCVIDSWADP